MSSSEIPTDIRNMGLVVIGVSWENKQFNDECLIDIDVVGLNQQK